MKVSMAIALGLVVVPVWAAPIPLDYGTYPVIGSEGLAAMPVESSFGLRVDGVVYSNMEPGSDGYVAADFAGGVLGMDDYNSINDAPITLTEVRFVGGVENAGEVLFFDFFEHNTLNWWDGFGVQFDEGGAFVWTITLGDAIVIPDQGVLQVTADDGSVVTPSTGQWYLGNAGPTVGSEDVTLFGDAPFSYNFELINIPEPATLMLLGIGAVALIRRG